MIDRLHGRRVLVIGDVMLDEHVWGETRRVSPEAPVPIVDVERRTWAPGGAANVAANLAACGAEVRLAGLVGADATADRLTAELSRRGVCPDLMRDATRPTTLKTRILARGQHVVRLDLETRAPAPAPAETQLVAWIGENLPGVDACVVSDYAKGVVTPRVAAAVVAQARATGKPVVVDTKRVDWTVFRGATLLTPNLTEAAAAWGRPISSERELLAAGRALLARVPGSALLVTRGADGMTLFRPRRRCEHIAARAREVRDVTGAGDTVVALLALALGAGIDLAAASAIANHAAGRVVQRVGTTCVSLDELAEAAPELRRAA